MLGGGSERGFVARYGRYRQRPYGYCYSLLCDVADAQDALQSTFAAAYAALRDGRRDAEREQLKALVGGFPPIGHTTRFCAQSPTPRDEPGVDRPPDRKVRQRAVWVGR